MPNCTISKTRGRRIFVRRKGTGVLIHSTLFIKLNGAARRPSPIPAHRRPLYQIARVPAVYKENIRIALGVKGFPCKEPACDVGLSSIFQHNKRRGKAYPAPPLFTTY